MTRSLANAILRLATRVAPTERRPWIAAAAAELETMENGAAALRWATGSLFAALGWAVRREWLYLVLLLGLTKGHLWIQATLIETAQARGVEFVTAAVWSQRLVPLAVAIALAAWRPHRAVVTAVILPVVIWTLPVRALVDGYPMDWAFELSTVLTLIWPFLAGAALGAVLGGRRTFA